MSRGVARGGWFPGSRAPISPPMRFFKMPSPTGGVRDLRKFLAARRPYELLMLLPALAITLVICYMFYLDYRFEKPYKRNIIYAESWPLNRTDAEIRAAQLTDQRNKKRQRLELKVPHSQQRESLKRVDDWLTAHGI